MHELPAAVLTDGGAFAALALASVAVMLADGARSAGGHAAIHLDGCPHNRRKSLCRAYQSTLVGTVVEGEGAGEREEWKREGHGRNRRGETPRERLIE